MIVDLLFGGSNPIVPCHASHMSISKGCTMSTSVVIVWEAILTYMFALCRLVVECNTTDATLGARGFTTVGTLSSVFKALLVAHNTVEVALKLG